MIIVSMTDIHGATARLADVTEDVAAADVVLLTGDLTHFGHREDVRKVLDAVREVNRSVLAVPGNCDHPDVGDYLAEEDVSVDGRHVVRDGVAFAGAGGSIPCPSWTPNEMTEGRLRAVLERAVDGLDTDLPLVLVCHQPPLDSVADVARRGGHVGSRSVREFIDARQPVLCFTGHIHESATVSTLGHTTIANPGPLRNGGLVYASLQDGRAEAEIRQA